MIALLNFLLRTIFHIFSHGVSIMNRLFFIILLSTLSNVSLASQVVYPAKGQSAAQQKTDEGECHVWAIDNSGYDPANPPVAKVAAQPSGPTGARLRGAAKGALIGEIAGGRTSDAAIAGAVMGGSKQRRDRRNAESQAQAQANSQQQAGLQHYNKARAACLEGRGYSVK